jgi:hypothetical protein
MPHGDAEDVFAFQLVFESGWKVDDYSVQTRSIRVPSFRTALPIIASIAAFNQFVQTKGSTDPQYFTTDGELRQALETAKSDESFPITISGGRRGLTISEDGKSVEVRYPDRTVQLTMGSCKSRRGLIDKVAVLTGTQWADVATMLAMKQKLKSLSIAAAFTNWTKTDQVAKSESSVLANAGGAEAPPAPKGADEQPDAAADAHVNESDLSNAVASQSIAEPPMIYVQPASVPVIHYGVYPINYRDYRRPYRRAIRMHRRYAH